MGKGIANILTPIVEAATLAFAPEAAPFLLPAEGAIGGVAGGGGLKGALLGGVEGLIGGQLGGTGEFAPFSSGGQSLGSQIFGGLSSALGLGADAAGSAIGGTSGSLIEPASGLGGALPEAGTFSLPSVGAGVGGSLPGAASTALPSTVASAPLENAIDLSGVNPGSTSSLAAPTGGVSTGGVADILSSGGASSASSAVSSIPDTTALSSTFTPTASAGGTGTGNSLTTFLNDPSLKNLGTAVGKNLNVLGSAAGLGLNLLQGQKSLAGEQQLKDLASTTGAQSAQLQSYLASGTLPPGLQAGLDAAKESAKTAIRSMYASRGMSGSSAEQADLAHADQAVAAQGGQLAVQLLQSGISEAGLTSQLYQAILHDSLLKDQSLGAAIANFASAAAGTTARAA